MLCNSFFRISSLNRIIRYRQVVAYRRLLSSCISSSLVSSDPMDRASPSRIWMDWSCHCGYWLTCAMTFFHSSSFFASSKTRFLKYFLTVRKIPARNTTAQTSNTISATVIFPNSLINCSMIFCLSIFAPSLFQRHLCWL